MSMDRRKFLHRAVAAGAGLATLPLARRAAALIAGHDGVWLGGDLHCHTRFSHDVFGGPANTNPQDAYTFGWTVGEQISNAETRGLDFLAITDHNDVRSLSDPAYSSSKLTLIRGYEHSLDRGHAGCLGDAIDSVFAIDTSTDAGVLALRDAVHAKGGTFLLNHPSYGEGWRYGIGARPDSIEVWNIGWPYRHVGRNSPPAPAVSDNYESLAFWERYLRQGPMPANGGSDNHYRATFAAQGVGQPTTWVYSADRTPASILAALKAGRTTVSAEPALLGGARTFLTAGANDEWMVGDTINRSGPVPVKLRVLNAPGHTATLIANGVALSPAPVRGIDDTLTWTVDAGPTRYVRAEVYLDETYWMASITSPLYFG